MCKSTRRGAKFILNTLNIQAHVRNDVKQFVGLVVILDRLEKVHISSISHSVITCVNLGMYKPSFGDTEKTFIFV
jgi:hypothetical protein